MIKTVYTKNAPEPVGPYSQAIIAGNFLYCSGQIAINPETNRLIDGGIEQETTQVMENIAEILKAAGFEFKDVIKTTCFLNDMNDFVVFNNIYEKYFISKPARSCVQAVLPKNAKVEVEIIAFKA